MAETTEVVQETPASTAAAAAAAREQERAVVLKELADLPDESAPEKKAEKAQEPDVEETETKEDEPKEADEAAEEEPPKAAAKEAEDPELAKRLDKIQKHEKRAREGVAKERQEFERQRQEFERQRQEHQASIERFEKLSARAKYDPAGVLAALGVGDEYLETAAKQLYARSQAGTKDPKLREYAEREMRDRQYADELAETRRELQEIKQERVQEREAAEQQRQVAAYLEAAAKAVTDETPIVRNLLSKNPDRARSQMRQVAEYLLEDTGEVPEPAEVVKALEQARRAELEEAGVDVASVTKKATPVAGETRAATTLSNDLATPTAPRAKQITREEEIAQVRKDLETGRLE